VEALYRSLTLLGAAQFIQKKLIGCFGVNMERLLPDTRRSELARRKKQFFPER
jgi:hypothetical protein